METAEELMKYFTKEWCFGFLSDSETEMILNNYEEYLSAIYNELPFVLKIIAKNISMHDGILEKAIFFEHEKNLILEGIFGDLQSGYFFLSAKYSNVRNMSKEVLVNLFDKKKLEIIRDEIELLSPNTYSHKIIFSSKIEIDVIFSDIQLNIKNSSQLHYKSQNCILEFIH